MKSPTNGNSRLPWPQELRGPSVAERLAEMLLPFLDATVEVSGAPDVITFREPDEALGLTVVVTAEAVEIRLPTIEWTFGSHGPVRSSVLWRRIRLVRDPQPDWQAALLSAVHGARRARLRQFRRCRFCGESKPPERRLDSKTCQACAERHLGVVF